MDYYVGVTNIDWFKYLSHLRPDDVNFWQPKGFSNFKKLYPGQPFLFKLKSPINKVAGVGFFSSRLMLPINTAWDVFEQKNGTATFPEFQNLILNHRSDKGNINPEIGCITLTDPIFFAENDWVELPPDWSQSIQQGKTYDTSIPRYMDYWIKIQSLIDIYMSLQPRSDKDLLVVQEPTSPNYGNPVLSKVRLGQSSFKAKILEIYSKQCSITGEKVLPVLEASHIKPYSQSGPHYTMNGLLLRSDIHKLFDGGYLTITDDYKIVVSKRINSEFKNGKEYSQYHGRSLSKLPNRIDDHPHKEFIEWHNANVYKE